MKSLGFIRDAFVICAAAALLASCGTNISTVPQGNRDTEAHSLAPVPFERPAGSRYHERVLWSFSYGYGNEVPLSGLIFDDRGALYGTLSLNGYRDAPYGTLSQNEDELGGGLFDGTGGVFKLAPSGSGYSESILWNFGGENDGASPAAGLIFDDKGALYGTTSAGGYNGSGTVFKLTPSGSGYSESILHSFSGGSDGANPYAGLIFDNKGALYGTTSAGGYNGSGTVFKLTPSGSGYSESILHSFSGGSDGANPYAGLIFDNKGALYGTTSAGGYNGSGTVFKLTPSGSGYSESILHSFSGGSDGANPYAGLTFDDKGALYGTTAGGGSNGFGTVFKLTPFGSSGYYSEKILLSLSGRKGGKEPHAALILDKKGALYGTTVGGGYYGFGTAFKLTPSGSGYSQRYSERVLHNFNFNNGAWPEAELTFGTTGALYGTASGGGNHGFDSLGTVFELAP